MSEVLAKIARWQQDPLLEKEIPELIYERPDFKEVLSGRRYFAIGHKGAGKSAVVRYVERTVETWQVGGKLHQSFETSEPARPIFLRIDARQLDLDELQPIGRNLAQAIGFWQELFYHLTLNKLALEYDHVPNRRGVVMFAVNELFQFLGGQEVTFTFRGLELKKHAGMSWTARANASRQFLRQATAQLPKGLKVFVAVDYLDNSFSAMLDEQQRRTYFGVVAGLLEAARSIRDLDGAHFGGQINMIPVVAVRSDIFQGVHSSNGEQILDAAVKLRWLPHEARHLLAHRISVATGIPSTEFAKNWSAVFANQYMDDVYDNKTSKTVFDFIELRTTWCPRDYIVFMRRAADFAHQANEKQISVARLVYSEPHYSQFLRGQLLNEAQSHISDLPTRLDQMQLMVLHNPKRRNFKLDDFATAFKLTGGVTESLLQELYKFNVVGNTAAGSGNTRYRFAHRQDSGILATGGDMVIHPGLYRSLVR